MIKPFYQDDHGNVIYLGSWESLIGQIDPASIDALITDSPYGTTALAWDKPINWPLFWPAIYRVCKPNAVQVMFSAQPFTTDLINSNRANYRYELIWPKPMPTGFLDANRRPLRAHENIEIFSIAPNSTTYNPIKTPCAPVYDGQGKTPSKGSSIYRTNPTTENTEIKTERHPTTIMPSFKNRSGGVENETAKPIPLMEWLILTYTNPGDLVLDPFVGRGSTAIACKKTGRRCIGFDIRESQCKAAARHLAQDVMVF